MAANPDARTQPTGDSDNASGPESGEELTRRNVDRILALEATQHAKASTADRVADTITSFSGSIRFVWITVLLVGSWVVFNFALSEPARVDPFPPLPTADSGIVGGGDLPLDLHSHEPEPRGAGEREA